MNIVDANIILRYLLQDAIQFLDQARDKIDFVDALLFAYSKIGGHTIFTFDKKLNQLLEGLNKA